MTTYFYASAQELGNPRAKEIFKEAVNSTEGERKVFVPAAPLEGNPSIQPHFAEFLKELAREKEPAKIRLLSIESLRTTADADVMMRVSHEHEVSFIVEGIPLSDERVLGAMRGFWLRRERLEGVDMEDTRVDFTLEELTGEGEHPALARLRQMEEEGVITSTQRERMTEALLADSNRRELTPTQQAVVEYFV